MSHEGLEGVPNDTAPLLLDPRARSEMFARILEISVDAAISVDEDLRIILFNRGAEQIFGYLASEVFGEPLSVLLPQRFHGIHTRLIREFGEGSEAARRMGERREIFGLRKDGEEFPAEASISKLDVDGRRIYAVVLRDITEHKEQQIALERHTRELARSNRELEEFASVASHDLQEPLRKIRAFGDRLRTGAAAELSSRSLEYLQRMLDAAERMSQLISDLLAYARVTSRPSPFARVDLTAVARTEVAALEARILDTGGEVDVRELPVVEADGFQIRQLFQNLIGNALKYHREGVPPRVEITGRISGDGKSVAEIVVTDNGIGFDERHGERIFEVFQRLHGRDSYEGTGMGLAICKKIAERHGGSIRARSTPGVGTTMIVQLPLTQSS